MNKIHYFIIFTLVLLIPSISNAGYWLANGARFNSHIEACKSVGAYTLTASYWTHKENPTQYADCLDVGHGVIQTVYFYEDNCHHNDTPATVFFNKGEAVPIVGCEKTTGGYCIWELQGDPNNPFITNLPNTDGGLSRQSVVHISKGFSPTCTERKKGECNPKDPYGGCYTPPNDKCTRHKDGSITCPPKDPPKIQQGCNNGETYCKRPKDGCGTGYVTGTFNGQDICVKANADNNTPNNPNTPQKDNNNNATGANNATNADNNNNTSSGSGANSGGSSGGSGGGSGSGGASGETGADNDKPNKDQDKQGNGVGCGNLSNCDWVKGSDFNKFVDYIKDLFSTDKIKEQAQDLEKIGEPSNDPRIGEAQQNASNAMNNLSNMLSFSNQSCISDMHINVLGKDITIPLSEYCSLMAIIKILMQISVYLFCLHLIVKESLKL